MSNAFPWDAWNGLSIPLDGARNAGLIIVLCVKNYSLPINMFFIQNPVVLIAPVKIKH